MENRRQRNRVPRWALGYQQPRQRHTEILRGVRIGVVELPDGTTATAAATGERVRAGNPIDLATGQQMPSTGGLSCGGLTPISAGLNYNPVDAFNGRAGTFGSFGLGWTSDYDIAFLPFDGVQKRLIMPGGKFINFVNDGSGDYRPIDDPRFDGAVIRALNLSANEWELKLKGGGVWRFAPFPGINGLIRGGPPTFVTAMSDPAGSSVSITRQANGRITAIGSQDRIITMSYGANGFVSEVLDTAGRTNRYTYTATNRIATITDADGKLTRYTYVDDTEIAPDPVCSLSVSTLGERIKTITYPGRATPTTNFYGSSRRVLRQTGFDGREFQVNYKVSGSCVTHTSRPGVICTGPTCPTEDSWENFQAGWRFHGGKITGFSVRNPDSSTRGATFNPRGLPLSSTGNLGLGQPVFAKYDAANRLTESSDVSGRSWRSEYDTKGNLTRRIDPLGRVTDISYDPKWNIPTTITRYLGGQPVITRMEYDPVTGRLTRTIDPLGNAADTQYNSRGELVQLSAPLGRVTKLEYNSAGDLVNVIDPMSTMASFATDGVGRTTATANALGYVTRTEYTGVSEVEKVIDPLQQEASFTFDPAGRIASVINTANVPVQTYQYDAGDRVTQVSDALGANTGYQYDAAGRLTQITDRKGRITRYFYDDAGRVIRIDFPDAERRLFYDALNRMQSIQDTPGASVSYTYDLVDRVVREEQVLDGLTTVIENTYDELDRRIRRTVNGQDPTTYAYDLAGRLTGITYRGQTTSYIWDAAGRLTRKNMPNGISVNYEYDLNDRETRISYQRTDGILIEDIAYEYDAAGQRIRRTSTVGSVPESPFTATYNAADRMTGITLNPGTAQAKTYALTYDANGNLAQKTNSADASDTTTYTWDSQNRLIGIQGSGLTATFRYDALNRRVEKTLNGQSVRYVYDGPQAIMEITGGQNMNLLTGLDTDEVIARYTQSGRTIYLQDALMSVIAQTREDQSVQNFYGYSPYGEALPTTDDQGNALEYTGRENDGMGLYYYRARYYDPILKRFVSEDPIGLAGGLNLYGYVGGSPTNLIDPSGMIPTCTTVKIGEDAKYHWEKEMTNIWSIVVPVPMGTTPQPDLRPPRGKNRGVPSPGWEVQLWEIGVIEWTQFLVLTLTSTFNKACSEWVVTRDSCGNESRWFFFDEKQFKETAVSRTPWGTWYEEFQRLILDPK